MARDDRFKRYQEAGADFLETARMRAEEFLRELAKMGDSTQKQAQGAVDELFEGGRKGTEQIVGSIRREITAQLSQLGLATKEDLAELERRLTAKVASAGGAGPAGPVGAAVGAPPAPAAVSTPAPATVSPAAGGPAVSAAGPTPAGSSPTLAKKAAATKTTAKKAAAKSPAEKVPGKKAVAKKAAPAKKDAGGI
jgi:polyhydroxyalkanoate synthesis regulator phasin